MSCTLYLSDTAPVAPARRLLINLLRRGSQGLDALATRLTPQARLLEPAPQLEYQRDAATGHGVLYEDGVRRFTFLHGLERL